MPMVEAETHPGDLDLPRALPRVVDFECYRAFLKAYFEAKKAGRSSFSYREFSARSGLKSPNYLQLVINGSRNLQESTAVRVAKAIGLTALEKSYFLSLVALANACEDTERQSAVRSFRVARSRLVMRSIDTEKRELLSNPIHLLVRELCFLKGFSPDPEWISHRLLLPVDLEQIVNSIDLLVRLGYLKKGSTGFLPSDPVINTGDSYVNEAILEYHRRVWKDWAAVLETSDPQNRELGVLNIPISKKNIPELRARMKQFQDEIIGWLEQEKEPDTIVQLGVVLMPMTRI